jgi:hypothetical protein
VVLVYTRLNLAGPDGSPPHFSRVPVSLDEQEIAGSQTRAVKLGRSDAHTLQLAEVKAVPIHVGYPEIRNIYG